MRKLRSIIACILLGLATVSLLSACQPTPESDVVVNKGTVSLDMLVLEKADPTKTWAAAGDRVVWNETMGVNTELGAVTATVNMDVEMPEYPAPVPVYLIEPGTFSMDFLKEAAGYTMNGEILDGTESQQDIMAEILGLQEDVSAHTVLDKYQSDFENRLNQLKAMHDNVPEKNSEARYEFVANQAGVFYLRLKCYLDDHSIASFTAPANDVGDCDTFFFRVNEANRSLYDINQLSGENIQAEGTELTYGQALEIADSALTTMVDGPFAMVHASLIDKINDVEYLWNDDTRTSLGQAYVFCYTREYDGVPSLYINPVAIYQTDETEFAKPYSREYAQIVVDDRGIICFNYQSFSKAVKKLNDDVKLMPFDEVMKHFKDDLFYHSVWGNTVTVTITGIDFGLVREPVKDNPEQFMMVPAWNFIGDVQSEYVEEKGKSILALNAIDGSIITDYQCVLDPK